VGRTVLVWIALLNLLFQALQLASGLVLGAEWQIDRMWWEYLPMQ
jgi:hypothetical protein